MDKISQLLMCGLVIALALFVVGCTHSNATSSHADGAAANIASSKMATSPEAQAPSNPEDKMPRIKVQEAMKETADGKAVIVDVRGTDAYKMAHIKGALDIPLPKIESKDFNGLPKDKRIIAYCT